jgi:hypothetical protein
LTITLPANAEAAIRAAAPAPCQRAPKGETFLVVEDEEALREVTRWIFTRNGYQGRLDPGVALVEKPFSEADLLATAGQVLNGHFQGFTTIQGTPPDAVQLPQTEFEGAAFKLSGPPGAVRRAGVLLLAYDDAGPCFEVPVL